MFSFPTVRKRQDQREGWIRIVRRILNKESWTPLQADKICSGHFVPSLIKVESQEISPAALPTINLVLPFTNLNSSHSTSYHQPCESQMGGPKCIIPSCKLRDRLKFEQKFKLLYHRFPGKCQKLQREKWISILRRILRNDSWELMKKEGERVCSRHFNIKDISITGFKSSIAASYRDHQIAKELFDHLCNLKNSSVNPPSKSQPEPAEDSENSCNQFDAPQMGMEIDPLLLDETEEFHLPRQSKSYLPRKTDQASSSSAVPMTSPTYSSNVIAQILESIHHTRHKLPNSIQVPKKFKLVISDIS